jgi:hypothetical protein
VSHLEISGYLPELHEVPFSTMAGWIQKVVDVESPVHVDVVVRRIVEACGVKRVGSRIRATYDEAVRFAVRKGHVEERGEFLYKVGQTEMPLRNREDLTGEKRMVWVANEEVDGVILALIDRAYGYAEEDLIYDTSHELGFQRVTQEIRDAVVHVILGLRQHERIRMEGLNYVKGKMGEYEGGFMSRT